MKQIKIVQQIGNGGHIYLPKELVGQKILITSVEKTIKDIEDEILYILRPCLKHVKGIYIYGSYARNEQNPDSDIDILVITDSHVKIKKKVNEYEIISATPEQIEKTINNNAVLILPILKESKPLLNQQLIERYKKQRLTKKNTRWYIETTESSLNLSKDWIADKDNNSIPNIVYPLILRLRGLALIKSLIYNATYSNKGIINYLVKKGISADKAEQFYKVYGEHRDNKAISKNYLNYNDIERLYNVVHKYYLEIKSIWEKLK